MPRWSQEQGQQKCCSQQWTPRFRSTTLHQRWSTKRARCWEEGQERIPFKDELRPEPRAADQTERVRAPRERARHRDGAVVEAPQQEEWKKKERWERGLPRRAVAAA